MKILTENKYKTYRDEKFYNILSILYKIIRIWILVLLYDIIIYYFNINILKWWINWKLYYSIHNFLLVTYYKLNSVSYGYIVNNKCKFCHICLVFDNGCFIITILRMSACRESYTTYSMHLFALLWARICFIFISLIRQGFSSLVNTPIWTCWLLITVTFPTSFWVISTHFRSFII